MWHNLEVTCLLPVQVRNRENYKTLQISHACVTFRNLFLLVDCTNNGFCIFELQNVEELNKISSVEHIFNECMRMYVWLCLFVESTQWLMAHFKRNFWLNQMKGEYDIFIFLGTNMRYDYILFANICRILEKITHYIYKDLSYLTFVEIINVIKSFQKTK